MSIASLVSFFRKTFPKQTWLAHCFIARACNTSTIYKTPPSLLRERILASVKAAAGYRSRNREGSVRGKAQRGLGDGGSVRCSATGPGGVVFRELSRAGQQNAVSLIAPKPQSSLDLPDGSQWRYREFLTAVKKGKVEGVPFTKDDSVLHDHPNCLKVVLFRVHGSASSAHKDGQTSTALLR